ncbi:HAD family hydrolase [Ideonella livida]|uniref:HAD family phosphatase n=1 Tax=Ideonella livida TaxID=2707176 RepID=A0A7C9PHU9_9BURK|nr:HAD family phosphatase [Ideonella livida]NDY92373.1 HAD family phosphatase [Ideonella livida]
MSTKPHVIFDFGVVLFRWRPEVVLRQTLPGRVRDAASAAHWKAQIFQDYGGDWGDFDAGLLEVPELVARIATRTGLTPAEVLTVVQAVPPELEIKAGTVAIVQALRAAGHRLFYLSNMPEPYARHLETHHPLREWFEDGVFSARVRQRKPDPAIFHTALRQFGIPAADALFIDDHPANIATARGLGLPGLLFESPEQLARDLRGRGLAVPAVIA